MEQNGSNLFINFLTLKKYRVLRHSITLVVLFIFIINYDLENVNPQLDRTLSVKILTFAYLALVAMFYVNMYWLVPNFLYKEQYLLYFALFSILAFLGFLAIKFYSITYVEPHLSHPQTAEGPRNSFYRVTFSMMPFIMASTALKLFQRWVLDNRTISELENKALKSELNALKNQINPHFLFNMLNNLNVLIKRNPEKASQLTLKISDFLRHHLYENNQPAVLLSTEIKFLGDYLELEKVRRDGFTYEVDVRGALDPNLQLPPNILPVFVENAIKHSLDGDSTSSVQIEIDIHEKEFHFTCINSKPVRFGNYGKKGLGLENVKRRLELLYGRDFSLVINDWDTMFKMTLILPL